MSFNLNKSDEEVKSAFDLDKGTQGGAKTARGGSNKKSSSRLLWLVVAVVAIGGLVWMMGVGEGDEETQPLAEQVQQAEQLDEEPASTSPVSGGAEESGEEASANQAETANSELSTPDSESPGSGEPLEEGASEPASAAQGTSESTTTTASAEQPEEPTSMDSREAEPFELPVLAFAKSNSNWNQRSSELDGLVRFLKSNPTQRVELLGYASSEGEPAFNQWISKRRAQTIADLLVAKGISAGRISVVGKGSQNPVASNATEAGRSKNRRVEINLK